ncbi:MAG: tetratricopeptide repeat protein [Kiritimatiellae bacterium]|nr:tetratricopeptide repeat protein [Kiritimatiellia bacterium]
MTRSRYLIPALLVLATGVVFLPAFRHGFVLMDDNFNVFENPALNPVSWHGVLQFWTHPVEHHMYPLTSTFWAALAAVSPRDARGVLQPGLFHALNVAMHALAALLVFAVARTWLRATAGPAGKGVSRDGLFARAACAGALLFAVHPVQVEVVSWVTGGKDVLAGLLSLTALWQYLRFREAQGGGAGEQTDSGATSEMAGPKKGLREEARPPLPAGERAGVRGRPSAATRHAVAATAAFALAVVAKSTAGFLPLLACALGSAFGPERNTALRGPGARLQAEWRRNGVLLLWVLMALPWLLLAKYSQPERLINYIPRVWTRPLVACDAIAFYLYKLAVPWSMGTDYGRSPLVVLSRGWIFLTWLVPAGLLALVAGSGRHRTPLLVCAGVFVAGLFPVLGLIPFRFQDYSTVADRYLYVAMLGPGLAAAYWLAAVVGDRKRRAAAVAAVAVLALLGVRSLLQTRVWREDRTLFTHALDVNPRSYISHHTLGIRAERRNDIALAAAHFEEAIRRRQDFPPAYIKLGAMQARLGRPADAILRFQQAIRIEPGNVDARNNLGTVLAAQGRMAEAMALFSEAVTIDPHSAGTHYNLGVALAGMGKTDEALAQYADVLRINPRHAEAHNNSGALLQRRGEWDRALFHYAQAVRLDPGYAEAHYNLACALRHAGRTAEAAVHFSEALRLNPGLGQDR